MVVHPPKRGEKEVSTQTGHRNTTITKNIALLRWFLKWALDRGYYQGNLLSIWKPKKKEVVGNDKEIIFLEWDELMSVYNFTVPESKQYLARVRDVFCFECFTGLRYSDVSKLTWDDVKDGEHIRIVTKKTGHGLKIELNKYSQYLLDKYKNVHYEGNTVFPVISNVNANVYLKELGKLVGLDEPIKLVYFLGNKQVVEVYPKHELLSTHCGRRSFVVNALTLGVSPEVIMTWTGHKNFSAMKPYVKILDELKKQGMSKFDQR